MRFFGKKAKKKPELQKKSSFNITRPKTFVVFIIAAISLGILLRESLQWYSIKERLVLQEKENAQIHRQIVKLEQEKEKLKNADSVTIEKQAREKLNFTRPGEVVYVPSTTQ